MDATLATALSYIPKDATTVQFGDSTPWLTDHGFAKTKPVALLDDPKYFRAQPSYQESPLWDYSRAMQGWGWTPADFTWSASVTLGQEGSPVHYVRFHDDLSLATVEKSLLAHGYKKDGSDLVGPGPAAAVDPVVAGVVLGIGQHVRFYPDKHLMVGSVGDLPELPSTSDSLGAQADIRSAVAPISSAYYVIIGAGSKACMTPSTLLPAALQSIITKLGLMPMSTTASVSVSDTKSIATAVYPSSDEAKQDLPHRQALLRGNSLVQNEPYASMARFTVTQDKSTLRYTIDAKPLLVQQMSANADAPWAMCRAKPASSTAPTS